MILWRFLTALTARAQCWLRPVLEFGGLSVLSRPALHHLDREIERLLPIRNGWFVEAGANDGFQQSNTYYLARFKAWQGVLIEPVPELAERCQRRRPESVTVNCALGTPDQAGSRLALREAGLMTTVCGALGSEEVEQARAQQGRLVQGLDAQVPIIEVEVRTLTEVLSTTKIPVDFDLLSLDVEGYEVEVLRGLDFTRYRPRAICLEVRQQHLAEVERLLQPYYKLTHILHETAAHGDYFWQWRD
jgi:FkbM family methyltransferase